MFYMFLIDVKNVFIALRLLMARCRIDWQLKAYVLYACFFHVFIEVK